jgi:hypothetical protein
LFDEATVLAEQAVAEKEGQKKRTQHNLIARAKAVKDQIRDYDPKQGGEYFNRFCYADFRTIFDLDEECKSNIITDSAIDV